jgi:hypothetical protein
MPIQKFILIAILISVKIIKKLGTAYGGGNATLITLTYVGNTGNNYGIISVNARQHRPGLGWDDSASTFHHNEPIKPIYWIG